LSAWRIYPGNILKPFEPGQLPFSKIARFLFDEPRHFIKSVFSFKISYGLFISQCLQGIEVFGITFIQQRSHLINKTVAHHFVDAGTDAVIEQMSIHSQAEQPEGQTAVCPYPFYLQF